MSDIGFDFVRAEPPYLLGVLGLGDARLQSAKYNDYVFVQLKSRSRANDAAIGLSRLDQSALPDALAVMGITALVPHGHMPATETYAIRFTVPRALDLDPLLVLSECVGCAKSGKHPLAWLKGDALNVSVGDTALPLSEVTPAKLEPVAPNVQSRNPQPISQRADRREQQQSVARAPTIEHPLVDKAKRLHTELQALCMEIGYALKLAVHVARNDRSAKFNGRRLDEIVPNLDRLPLITMDRQLQSAYELIDLVFMNGSNPRILWEFECTTSVSSGLIRMADVAVQQDHLNIPMIVVAPEDRRAMVEREATRPYLNPFPDQPLYERIRYMSERQLRELHALVMKHPSGLNLNIITQYSSGFEIPKENSEYFGNRRARMQAGSIAEFSENSLLR